MLLRSRIIARAARASALAAALLVPQLARAGDSAEIVEARKLFMEGSKLAEAGQWTEARDRYQRSLALKRSAVTLYSLGVAQRSTGQIVEALESFRAFLAEPSTPATAPYEAPARAAISALAWRVARIDLTIEPAEAKGAAVKVKIDGRAAPAAADGQSITVNPGERTVTASLAGYHDARAVVKLAEGGRAGVKLVLQALTPAEREAARAAEERKSRAVPFALLGGGALVAGVGVGVGIAGVIGASEAPSRDGPAASEARTLALTGDIMAGVGLVAVAAGGILLLVSPPVRPEPKTVTVQPFIGLGGAGVRGTF